MWTHLPFVVLWGVTAVSIAYSQQIQPCQQVHPSDFSHVASSGFSGCYYFHESGLRRIANVKRLPGEFEAQQHLLLASSGDHVHSKTVAQIAHAAQGKIQPIVLVNDLNDREQLWQDLIELGVDPKSVKIIYIQHDSKWVRDFGPTALLDEEDVHLVDWFYFEDRKSDDDVSISLSRISATKTECNPLRLEGGNLLSNGKGIVVTSERVLQQNNEHSTRHIRFELAKQLNASTLVILEPLVGEPTQHVDMFATFTSPRTIVVGSYPPEVDPVNAAILDRNAKLLSQVKTSGGGRLRVKRIPMGSREGDCWRTYTNCVYANGVLIVPSYGEFDDPKVLSRVLRTYRRLLPSWSVTTVDASNLIEEGGALRCAALNITKLNKTLDSTPEYQLPRMIGSPEATPMPFVSD